MADARASRRPLWALAGLGLGLSATLFWLLASDGWTGDDQMHTVTEGIASVLGLVVGFMGLLVYRSGRDRTALFLGIGFLGAGLLDAYHAVLSSTYYGAWFPFSPPELETASWLVSRTFLASYLWLALRPRATAAGGAVLSSDRQAYRLALMLMVGMLAISAVIPLPAADGSMSVPRLLELVPAVVFTWVLADRLRTGGGVWPGGRLDAWLALSLLLGVAAHLPFMTVSQHPYDAPFVAAHLLKVASYVAVLVGMGLDLETVFRAEEAKLNAAGAALDSVTQRLTLATQAARMGVWEWGVDAGTLTWDQQMYRLYGVSPEAFSGAYEAWERGLHPDDRERARAEVFEAAESEGGFHTVFRVRRPDGEVRFIEAHATVVREADGTRRMIGVNWDVTERHETELRTRRLNEELEARVAARTQALVAANRELESFAHTVSHDLRAPLRQVDGFSRLVLEDHGGELSDEARRMLGMVRAGALRMGVLIDELLAFSRLSRAPMRVTEVDPVALARECVDGLLVPGAGGNGQGDAVLVHPMPPCRADLALLRQVYLNLLDNALKFSEGRESPRVEVGCREVDGVATYYVADRGVGFDMRYADKLFGVFQRLHGADEFPGTGVGLATVQRIVKRHGGTVWADAEVGRGATFFFTLSPEEAPS